MSKLPNKENMNQFLRARLKAANDRPELKNRESAAAEIGISQESLAKYERAEYKMPPVEKIIILANEYNSPELLNNYCSNECPIGKKIVQPIDLENIDNMYRFAVLTSNDLDNSVEIKKTLLKIVEDGIIDESEKEELDTIIEFFTRLEKRSKELKILAQKYSK